MTDAPNMIITGLFHDIARQRSIVSLVWSNDPEKRLGLDVPYGCTLQDLPAAAEKAVRDLAALTGKMAVVMPG